jgi:hypothetical protein
VILAFRDADCAAQGRPDAGVTSREGGSIADRSHYHACDDRADTWNSHQSPTARVAHTGSGALAAQECGAPEGSREAQCAMANSHHLSRRASKSSTALEEPGTPRPGHAALVVHYGDRPRAWIDIRHGAPRNNVRSTSDPASLCSRSPSPQARRAVHQLSYAASSDVNHGLLSCAEPSSLPHKSKC